MSNIAQVEGSGTDDVMPATSTSKDPELSEKMSSLTPRSRYFAPPGIETVSGPSPVANGVPITAPDASVNAPISAFKNMNGPVFVGSMKKLGNGSPDEPIPVSVVPIPSVPLPKLLPT